MARQKRMERMEGKVGVGTPLPQLRYLVLKNTPSQRRKIIYTRQGNLIRTFST